ncbi:MAG: CDP-alcohol phosphatidyltransferase family protein [Methanobacteriaceae archaeon]|jgi:archaetidylinositol phosphate synthase|nr:CDP-alcohol phosphatidyltransferase family protein [Methanobacteriaceae archaeon]
MLDFLRPTLTKILNPLAKVLKINPNILTLISPFIALLSAYFYAEGFLILGAIVILFSGFFDVIDGAVARYHGKSTEFGAFLDSTMDRFSDAIVIIGLVLGGYCTWFTGILLVHSAITVSYVRARADTYGVVANVGIAERAVRLLVIVLASVITFFTSPIYFEYIMIILVILSYLTVAQRIYYVYKNIN